MNSKKQNYICFVENNDWEGETWRFYMPLGGNEGDIEKVNQLLNTYPGDPEDCPYRFELDIYTNADVKVLVRHSRGGYIDSDNLVLGFKELPKKINWKTDDPFYKAKLIRWRDE